MGIFVIKFIKRRQNILFKSEQINFYSSKQDFYLYLSIIFF